MGQKGMYHTVSFSLISVCELHFSKHRPTMTHGPNQSLIVRHAVRMDLPHPQHPGSDSMSPPACVEDNLDPRMALGKEENTRLQSSRQESQHHWFLFKMYTDHHTLVWNIEHRNDMIERGLPSSTGEPLAPVVSLA